MDLYLLTKIDNKTFGIVSRLSGKLLCIGGIVTILTLFRQINVPFRF